MRLSLYLMILVLALEHLWWLALPTLAWYAFKYTTYELLLIAILIDGYTGQFNSLPVYSLATLAGVLVVEWIRPKILSYTD